MALTIAPICARRVSTAIAASSDQHSKWVPSGSPLSGEKWSQVVMLSAAMASAPPQPTPIPRSGSDHDLILATTTSTQDSGLLDVLVPLFQDRTGYQVKTVSVGTGAALALGARGEADVVLVHAPASEAQWMAQGNGTR